MPNVTVNTDFEVTTVQATYGDYRVQPRDGVGTAIGDPITTGLTSTFFWRGSVPAGTWSLDLISEAHGLINTQLAHGGLSAGGNGTGDILVNHDYGEADRYRAVISNVGQDNVIIRAYLKADRVAHIIDPEPPYAITGQDGRWPAGLLLTAGTYLLNFYNPATRTADEFEVAVGV